MGNTSVPDRIVPEQTFAETHACAAGERLMVNITAAEAADILFLNRSRMPQVFPY